MDRQVGQMTRLVDDLLDVSRIAHGKLKAERVPVEVADAAAQAVEGCRPRIDARGQHLSVSVPPGLRAEADPTRLAQVLSNLLSNASKYTPPGGHVWLTGVREGNEVVLAVRDDGIGIGPEMLERVFDLFVQDEAGQRLAQGGLGIGLSLVRSLVEMQGGTVRAFSEGPGRGSTFVVRLPAAP